MDNVKKVKKSSFLVLMALTLGSRIMGLIREMTKARIIGGGALSDAFNIAFVIPNLLRRLFAESSMTVAFIPTFKGYLKEENKKETQEFLNSIFTTLTFLVSLTVIIGIIGTPLIVKLVDQKKADIDELIFLTRIMFPYLAFISIAAIFQGILNSLNIFAPGGFVPILFNITVVSATLALSKLTQNPARAMALGVTLGGFFQMSFQLPFILKNGFKIGFTGIKRAFNHPGTKKVGRLIAPTLVGMGVYQLNTVVANFIAINTGEGVSSSLTYSLRLQELVLGIFAVSIGTILISTLSKNVKDGNWSQFTNSISLSLNVIALLTIPVTIFAIIHSNEIVELVYGGGLFGTREIAMTASVFRIHIAGLFFIAITRILGPAFYSLEDSKTPAYLGIISIGCSIIMMFSLAPILKGEGLALAVTISSVILMILYFIFMGKKENIGFTSITKSIVPGFIKVAIYSIISAIPMILIKPYIYNLFISNNRYLSLIPSLVVSTVFFFAIYSFLLLITKDKNIKILLKHVKKR